MRQLPKIPELMAESGKLRAAILLSDEERETLGRKERIERFKMWQKEQEV
jgi:hypothetical protein